MRMRAYFVDVDFWPSIGLQTLSLHCVLFGQKY